MAVKCHESTKRALRNHVNACICVLLFRYTAANFQTKLGESLMNWDQIEGRWKQLKGSVKQKWGNLTDDDLDVVAGRQDQLAGKIQERYGMTKEEAAKRVREWSSAVHDVDTTTPQHRAS